MFKENKIKFALRTSFLIYILLVLTVPINCQKKKKDTKKDEPKQEEPDDYEKRWTTPADVTSPKAQEEPTDIPQSDIDDALILDYGRYTTVSFHYENQQWMGATRVDRCYDDYTRCITSLEAPAPVCMFYQQRTTDGYRYVNSYCDVYLANCRVGYRYWRIIQNGKCDLGYLNGWDQMIEV